MGTGLLVFALGSLTGTPATAEPEKKPSEADLAEAARLYESGVDAAKRQEWEKARAAHAAAWRLVHHTQIAMNLARAELKTGKYRDAAEHLSYFLEEAKCDAEKIGEADRKVAEKMFAEARAKVGVLRVKVQPVGAEVLVDEAPVGKASLNDVVFVEPGRRVIAARMGGFVTTRAVQDVAPGGSGEVTLTLPEVGKPELLSPPTPPPPPPDVGVGPSKAVVVSGIVATVALAGAGVGLKMAAGEIPDENERTNILAAMKRCAELGNCNEVEDRRRKYNEHAVPYDRFTNLSTAAFIGAGAVGAGTLLYTIITASSKKEQRRPQASFVFGPGGFGASLKTSF